MSLTVEYRWECSVCKETAITKFRHREGMEMVRPCLPADWKSIMGICICGKHNISVNIDNLGEPNVKIEWPRVKGEG